MNPGDRIIVRSNHRNTITFYRRHQPPRTYTVKPTLVHAERLYNMTEDWPAHSGFDDDGSYWTEYHVSDRALPPEADPNQTYYDYLETIDDFVASTRN